MDGWICVFDIIDVEAGVDADRLLNRLFNGNKYFATLRPAANESDSVKVKLGIYLVQIFELV